MTWIQLEPPKELMFVDRNYNDGTAYAIAFWPTS